MALLRPRRGQVTGYVLKLVRESIPMSQEQLAEALGVDRGTIQGWESGRRAFTSVPFGQAVALRHRLVRLGADSGLLHAMNDAAEADFLLGEIIDTDTGDLARHPLAYTVLTHAIVEMVTWAITGATPQAVRERIVSGGVRRRGPVAAGPSVESSERETFFAGLRSAADRSAAASADHAILLHRQACFLSGMAEYGEARWLRHARHGNYFTRASSWSPVWADARSMAAALARQGDPEPLRAFIANAHADDACELASLNYWAYWVGEVSDRQHDDRFMISTGLRWRGLRLLRHLVDRLHHDHRFVDLNVHTVWALLAVQRGLAGDDPALTRTLYRRGERLLDEATLSTQSRRELTEVLYGLRMDGIKA